MPLLVAAAPRAAVDVVFSGMCDASGAVALTQSIFVVADDEGNLLRAYDARVGGAPLSSVDVSAPLGVSRPDRPARPGRPAGPRPAPEMDIEAATRSGELAFWITSHGRNSAGKLRPERLAFFATTAPREPSRLAVVGTSYTRLLDDLAADPRFAPFGLEAAAQLPPKAAGGLSIEGMTERRAGGLFIGFRSPTPQGRALVISLLNPADVVRGGAARFGEPLLLDLGGLGVRALSWWRGRYLVVAGHHADGADSRLYAWDGGGAPVRLMELPGFNPEGFFTPEGSDQILLLSDDGSALVDGVECKSLTDSARKRFRGRWVSLPPAARAGSRE